MLFVCVFAVVFGRLFFLFFIPARHFSFSVLVLELFAASFLSLFPLPPTFNYTPLPKIPFSPQFFEKMWKGFFQNFPQLMIFLGDFGENSCGISIFRVRSWNSIISIVLIYLSVSVWIKVSLFVIVVSGPRLIGRVLSNKCNNLNYCREIEIFSVEPKWKASERRIQFMTEWIMSLMQQNTLIIIIDLLSTFPTETLIYSIDIRFFGHKIDANFSIKLHTFYMNKLNKIWK